MNIAQSRATLLVEVGDLHVDIVEAHMWIMLSRQMGKFWCRSSFNATTTIVSNLQPISSSHHLREKFT
jgi:hypothetical protein